ncbi:SgcJ/EcaC family oxidoreductase [Amycolatopsis sp. EV170708-02-1]|uniref:SgcJ/EcaC family oxidoreductase n=1 Tax=Amycolatopsis sp. EV170708-02-1 TaxID=2919322 RepID=UPI001F0C89EB|nr:SgcJ/EcaC family oxidoreductase [Amycolatopsis sp. EV170708-02-1]UMO99932.1 SgcJ/EcaC family oxidoreductase [Amycolatopsis sp. EV170708-02-1]
MRSKAMTLTGICTAAAGLAVMSACSAGNAQPAQPQQAAPSQQVIAGLFDDWNAALATGDADKVADLYAPDAVLLPTVSNKVRTDRAAIVDYFRHFLANKPVGKIEQEVVGVLDADTAVNTGVYRFDLTQNGSPQQVQARYTFVYELRGGKWLIVNHHSSTMPEKKQG